MEINHIKTQRLNRKFKTIFLFCWWTYIATFLVASIFNLPELLLLIPLVAIAHIICKGVYDAEIEVLNNEKLFNKESLKNRHD